MKSKDWNFRMTEDQAILIHDTMRDTIAAHKNWIASAVESGDLERAQRLVRELRKREALAASFNVRAKIDTADYIGKPVERDVVCRIA